MNTGGLGRFFEYLVDAEGPGLSEIVVIVAGVSRSMVGIGLLGVGSIIVSASI